MVGNQAPKTNSDTSGPKLVVPSKSDLLDQVEELALGEIQRMVDASHGDFALGREGVEVLERLVNVIVKARNESRTIAKEISKMTEKELDELLK